MLQVLTPEFAMDLDTAAALAHREAAAAMRGVGMSLLCLAQASLFWCSTARRIKISGSLSAFGGECSVWFRPDPRAGLVTSQFSSVYHLVNTSGSSVCFGSRLLKKLLCVVCSWQ